MYGKVIAASGAAYLLTFEVGFLPAEAALVALGASTLIVVTDVCNDGPVRRIDGFFKACAKIAERKLDRMEQAAAVREAARRELAANYGIQMAEELKPADREWLREQAAMTLKSYGLPR